MIHWGMLVSCLVLGTALLIGVTGLWGAKGSVMWLTRVTFVIVLFGTLGSILARRRDLAPPGER